MNFRLIQSNPVQLVVGDTPATAHQAFHDFLRKNAEAYRAYLNSIKHRVPAAVYDFAAAEWHYDPNDHKCPHDAWVQEIRVLEVAEGERAEARETRIEIMLLGAYHDRLFKLTYFGVSSYRLTTASSDRGHGDWITDEIRLSDSGLVVHEIEFSSGSNVLIECKDMLFEEKLTDTPYSAKW